MIGQISSLASQDVNCTSPFSTSHAPVWRVASLFCGCGGTEVGLRGGFQFLGQEYAVHPVTMVYANDLEAHACSMFAANCGLKPDNRDIRQVLSSEIPDCDILTGGFPCQAFSIVAQNPPRLGIEDDRGKLFFEMCRVLRDKQPSCFIAENVKGLLTANQKQAFPLILEEFTASGYDVRYAVLNAADFGVRQKRERVFIVGFRQDLQVEFSFPQPTHAAETTWIPLVRVLEPQVDEKYYFSERAVQGMLAKRATMNKGRAQDITQPCNTVGAHLAKVSLNSTDPVLFEQGRYRRFTPREVARIQSFPESYQLLGSETAQYRALGNAIPPVLFWHVAHAVLEHLERVRERETSR